MIHNSEYYRYIQNTMHSCNQQNQTTLNIYIKNINIKQPLNNLQTSSAIKTAEVFFLWKSRSKAKIMCTVADLRVTPTKKKELILREFTMIGGFLKMKAGFFKFWIHCEMTVLL